ncbi:hypothetical protein [Acinetobacter sp. MD2(2019)]|uniref:hypothetical protein n=1 Tax=Acinetobacter sp. MD2(2019) TaxID=2605273 RepID=UPI002D1F43BB|nr:hypothetical protein [Acinetobacter sp. MD2(2019)]MEB3754002.1 hypothetical protein [Acinetobacter sp. MD2(2019)]
MKFSIKLKFILYYSFSPFITGFILFFIYGVKDLIKLDEKNNILSILIGAPLGAGLIALIIFSIPATIVGSILYKLRHFNKLKMIVSSVCIGFSIPFFLLYIPMTNDCSSEMKNFGGLLNCYYAARNMGVLGGITSFIVTLKLIYYPLTAK